MSANRSTGYPLKSENIPITLYIHLPWCLSKCPYCDFNSYDKLTTLKDTYLARVIQQAKDVQPALQGRSLSAIFIGGGTPNLFSLKQLATLLQSIFACYPVQKNIEISIEANPGINHKDFQFYPTIGINRLSLGVQSFQMTYLQSLKRIYDEKTLFNAIDAITQSKFTGFNIDLMFGLPNQTVKDSLSDLQRAISCGITHLSWYELTLEPNTPFAVQNIALPADDILESIQETGQHFLKQNGWAQYEQSAYSLPFHQCQHNLNYWQFGDYIGLGAGAHSKITQFVEQKIVRIENHSNVSQYCQTPIKQQQILSHKEATTDFMINALRLYQPILFDNYINRTGNQLSKIQPFLNYAVIEKFITLGDNFILTTKKGKKFMNQLLLELVAFE
jgi:oxygen-independent coproporphyrinogen-3 oxidase